MGCSDLKPTKVRRCLVKRCISIHLLIPQEILICISHSCYMLFFHSILIVLPTQRAKFMCIHVFCTWKSSIVTAIELSRSASMVSSSRSMRVIFFRMACRAASEHKAARSAPTWPWVSVAIWSILKKNHININILSINQANNIYSYNFFTDKNQKGIYRRRK